jgi:acyl-coenzyme A synthetase/AMP-(fatty) acid ligase/acyl carrier protein
LHNDEIINIDLLVEKILMYNATLISCSPLLLNALNNMEGPTSIRKYISGGDVLKPAYVTNLVKKADVYNTYGPTESTVCATYYKCRGNETDFYPIGKPIMNYQIYILDENEGLSPVGIPGELCISGDGVTRGYLFNEELTRQKFVKNPFIPGKVMYRSGDLARWLPEGNIEFLGRIDHQVKIRGYRVEIGEIENCLFQHENIQSAVVTTIDNTDTGKELVAYYFSEKEIESSEIRSFLEKHLPAYMIPSYFVQIEKWPLTSGGKIDRKSLPDPLLDKISTGVEYVAPRNKTEEALVNIWRNVLDIDIIGVYDNFFNLGGHSLKAIKLLSIINKEFTVNLVMKHIFKNSTVESLAGIIDTYSLAADQSREKEMISSDEIFEEGSI